jgi:hypothetical protein
VNYREGRPSIGGAITIIVEGHSRRNRWRVGAAATLLALSALVSVLSFEHVAQASVTSTVPIVVCSTESGASPGGPVKSAATAQVSLPHALARRVSIYTDQDLLQSVLGPRGWHCIASYGADGNGGVTIFAKGETVRYFANLSKDSKSLQAINVDWTPACVLCILGQACPFFAAAKGAVTTLGYSRSEVSCARPRGELMVKSSRSLAYFSDPPGVTGTGEPSGGAKRALGLAVWEGLVKKGQRTITNGSAVVTCTLPSSDAQLCQESFSWFERRDVSKLKS